MATKRRQTAEEFMRELEADPEYLARKKEDDRRFAELEAQDRADERPVVEALQKAGLPVGSVWDLVNSRHVFGEAVPILVEHLKKPYGVRTKEGIARALTFRGAGQEAYRTLVTEFEAIKGSDSSDLKWVLANAISEVAEHQNVDELLCLAKNLAHNGNSRSMLLIALCRLKNPEVIEELESFQDDPEIMDQARSRIKNAIGSV